MNDLSKLVVKGGAAVFALIVVLWGVFSMMTTVGADEYVVKQDVMGGGLTVWNTPGVHATWFGTVTRYKRSAQLWFSAPPPVVNKDDPPKPDESIKVRFNDGGHGNISGSLRYSLPTDPTKMIALHQTYHSMEAIDHELVRQVVNKSVYMSGPLMSSRESFAEKRNDLISDIDDQILFGVYRTEHEQVKTTDPITNTEKTVDIVVRKADPSAPNGFAREEASPIQAYGLTVSNITISTIDYAEDVEAQIKQQQAAFNAVQQAIVNAKRAEQDAITVEQQGKAAAAKAKWDQEVLKATAVTQAQQEKDVATTQAEKDKEVAALALETAKLNGQSTVTAAKADAESATLARQANNNFQARLDAYVQVQQAWASAYGAQRQVPDVVMGGGSGSSVNAAMEALGVKAARDLQVKP